MRSAIFTLVCLLFLVSGFSQSWQWGLRGGSNLTDINNMQENVVDMATDPAGNLYLLCEVQTTGTTTLNGYGVTSGNGVIDILLISYDRKGAFRWKKMIGGSWNDKPLALGVDNFANVYITGLVSQVQLPYPYVNPVKFDTDTIPPYANKKSLFLARYDSTGKFVWLRQPTADTASYSAFHSFNWVYDMLVNKDGSIELFCFLDKGLLSGNGSFVADSSRTYILSYDKNGQITALKKPDLYWKKPSQDGPSVNFRMAKTQSGKYILSGQQSMYPMSDSMVIGGQRMGGKMWVACFNPQWQLLWEQHNTDGAYNGFSYRPVLDSQTSIYMAGSAVSGSQFQGYTFNNPFSAVATAFIAKLDSNGNSTWIKTANSKFSSFGSAVSLANGKAYLTGGASEIKFGSYGIKEKQLGFLDIFLAGFDAQTGNPFSLDSVTGNTSNYDDYPTAIVAGQNGDLFIGGMMKSNLTVANTVLQHALPGSNVSDFFALKFCTSTCPPQSCPVAAPLISSATASICSGTPVVLTSNQYSGNQWYKNDTLISGAVSQSFSANAPGIYTSRLGLGSCTSSLSNAITISVHLSPSTPVITIAGNLLSSSSVSGNQWYKDGVLIPGAVNQTFTATAPGLYKVLVTVNGCTAYSNSINHISTAIPSIPVTFPFSIAPNPVKNNLLINTNNSGSWLLVIFDAAGRSIERWSFSGRITMAMEKFPRGSYIIHLTSQRSGATWQRVVIKN